MDTAWIDDPALWTELRGVILPVVEPLFHEAFIVGAEMGAMQRPARSRPLLDDAVQQFATGLRALDPQDATVLPYDFDAIMAAADQTIGAYTDEWWAQFSASTQRQLRALILRAEHSGLSTAEVARSLEPIFGAVRAQRVAVSELTNLMGMGAQETYRRAGYSQWEWRTVQDSRVDTICRQRSRKRFPMSVGFRRAHVHCRCVVEGTDVTATGILSAMRRWHEGPVVTIRTASGRQLTVTPNHPIATPSGWLAAADLREGMDVLGDQSWVEDDVFADPRHMQRPARVEDVWNALRESAYGSPLAMESSPEDFHGDGGNGEVEVVWADRPLRLSGQPDGSQRRIESAFGAVHRAAMLTSERRESALAERMYAAARGIIGGRDLIGTTGVLALAPYQSTGLAASSGGDPGGAQALDNRVARYLELPGEFGDTRSGAVRRDDPRAVYVAKVPLLDHPSAPERSIQHRLGDSGALEQRVERLPADVRLNRLVEVRVGQGRCHVYNLETIDGWYSAAGIVSHNCWPVPAGKLAVQPSLLDLLAS